LADEWVNYGVGRLLVGVSSGRC